MCRIDPSGESIDDPAAELLKMLQDLRLLQILVVFCGEKMTSVEPGQAGDLDEAGRGLDVDHTVGVRNVYTLQFESPEDVDRIGFAEGDRYVVVPDDDDETLTSEEMGSFFHVRTNAELGVLSLVGETGVSEGGILRYAPYLPRANWDDDE